MLLTASACVPAYPYRNKAYLPRYTVVRYELKKEFAPRHLITYPASRERQLAGPPADLQYVLLVADYDYAG